MLDQDDAQGREGVGRGDDNVVKLMWGLKRTLKILKAIELYALNR